MRPLDFLTALSSQSTFIEPGRISFFTGRTILPKRDDDPKYKKYRHLHNSDLFTKPPFNWRAKGEDLVIVEGALDAMAVERLGGDKVAAMALMGLLMAPNAGAPVATAQASGHHSAHLAHGAVAVTPPTWFTVVCAVLAAGFCLAALWWFYLLVRGPKRPYADLLMALGMSAAFAVMAV